MMTADEIREALKDRNLYRVALGAGISPASVYRFAKNEGSPLYDTVKALSDYLEAQK